MSTALPMGWSTRLDNYTRQNGNANAYLKPGQRRRFYKKLRRYEKARRGG